MILLGFPEPSFTSHRDHRPKTGKQNLLYQRLGVVGLLFNDENSLAILVGHLLKHAKIRGEQQPCPVKKFADTF
jgi:hypothetical protein